jgi:putative redox protein
MDGAPESGGDNAGMRPMEMVLIGAGGCAAYDVVHILKTGREPVDGCVTRLTRRARRGAAAGVHQDRDALRGQRQGAQREQSGRAVALSAEKYCSASIMLGAAGSR